MFQTLTRPLASESKAALLGETRADSRLDLKTETLRRELNMPTAKAAGGSADAPPTKKAAGGTSAAGIDQAQELAEAKAAMLADPEFAERVHKAQAALIYGFLPWLEKAFPERWGDDDARSALCMPQILADVTHVSGYSMELLCAEPPETYAAWKGAFDAFGKEHFSKPEQAPGAGLGCICFHGSTRAAVEAIYEHGFDPERCREGAYGGGPGKPCAYVSNLLSVALMYSKPDEDGLLWAVYGNGHLGDPSDIPVGTPGQTDFGVRADGTPHVTLTNPPRSYWCLSDPRRQFIASGTIAFSIATDKRPSDFALREMLYPPAVWLQMRERIPGLVAYKQRLLAQDKRERRKARRNAAWAADVGCRTQPPRAAKRERGA